MNKKAYIRLFIIFCIVVFVAANGVFIYLYLNNRNKNQTPSYQITEYAQGVSLVKTINSNTVGSESNFSLVNNNFQIFALAGSEIVLGDSYLKLNKGTLLLLAENFTLELQGSKYLLANKYQILIDAEDGVITVEGDSAFNNKILDLNTQLLFVGSEIEQYEFERDNLTSKAKYTSLMSFLSDLNVLPQYFKDFSSPELISVSPRDNFITQERFVRLFGYTEVNSKIVFDDEVLVSDSEGYFTKQIDLNEGLNTVRFTLKDIYGNNKLVTLTYQRKKSTLPVASYPVSGPVSYPN